MTPIVVVTSPKTTNVLLQQVMPFNDYKKPENLPLNGVAAIKVDLVQKAANFHFANGYVKEIALNETEIANLYKLMNKKEYSDVTHFVASKLSDKVRADDIDAIESFHLIQESIKGIK
jgi:hypothetical protein